MIPAWNLAGVLPPIRPGEEGHGNDRSPYAATMLDVVDRFGTNNDRRVILSGLLDYRQALYHLNIVEGFQWLNGSFTEDVESLQGRSPNDVDVVTFFKLPAGETQASLWPQLHHLFDVGHTKQVFRVDGYPMLLAEVMEDRHVHQIAYWYSMWGHTRDRNWKGFLRVNLDPHADTDARQLLEAIQLMEPEQ
ncbi:hypothetical protein EN816_31545 [Mesorhizobium sp. M8A.F.Ca.ET.173.01.1.1]|nr:hypothetical protein EN816_31545 [Mesorhizobium sp. M8A.F.Ca.ET.173.01.1.1]